MAVEFFWVFEPGGNVEHIAEHDLTPEDVEHAYATATLFTTSRSSGLPAFVGLDTRYEEIFVVYRELDATTWHVETAYPIYPT